MCCHSGTLLNLEYLWKQDENFYDIYAADKQSDDVICISGCRDNQTSSDGWNYTKREAEGALTQNLITSFTKAKTNKIMWKDFTAEVRQLLNSEHYKQIPMLSVARKSLVDDYVDL